MAPAPVVASEVSALAFNAALFVAPSRVAELALVAPVGTAGDEAAGLFSLIATQNLLHGTGEVVIAKSPKDSGEVVYFCSALDTKTALTLTAIGALRSIQKQPERVENYFGQKDVAYAA